MSTLLEKISKLRSFMEENTISAFIITGSDPHMSEYVAPRWRSREYFSEFTGSAGTLIITKEKAGLWTDFRYWIQADKELEGSGIELFKAGLPGTIPYIDWIASELSSGEKAGIEGSTVSLKMAEEWSARLVERGIELIDIPEIPDDLWPDRPVAPATELYSLPLALSGLDRKEKIIQVRELLALHNCEGTFISSLDDIAWLLNIRAMDVKMNPVALAYCWIDENRTILFTDNSRFKKGTVQELTDDGIILKKYDEYKSFMIDCPVETLYFSRERNSWQIGNLIPDSLKEIDGIDLTTALKSRKNLVEIDCSHKAMVLDGAAMVNFLHWLEKSVSSENITEVAAAAKSGEFRRAQPGFIEESFSPISAYRSNGALCHYDPTEETAALLKPEGLFLLDSGGQYPGATTDITRTVSLGNPTEQEIRDYTLVLKGHIALSCAVFPEGTRGYQLDILARQYLWNRKMNFGHGTGHGVGAFLNVHEGPHSISPRPIDRPILEGTITSNEPGLYREGEHGIRIENLILATPAGESEFGKFLEFETLTLCPYDKKLIDRDLLTKEETHWINAYHRKVYDILTGLVEKDAELWLRNSCAPL
jgi:Xaa-Pro aminopeptidase